MSAINDSSSELQSQYSTNQNMDSSQRNINYQNYRSTRSLLSEANTTIPSNRVSFIEQQVADNTKELINLRLQMKKTKKIFLDIKDSLKSLGVKRQYLKVTWRKK